MEFLKAKLFRKWLQLANQRHERKLHETVTSSRTSNNSSAYISLPNLLILGGREGLDFLMPDPVLPDREPSYSRIGDLVSGIPARLISLSICEKCWCWWDEDF